MDFPTILARVKPGKRSDRLKVLAAIFAIGHGKNPVTVGQIRDLLTLHLGARIPANISASLRKYSRYVRVQKGPPLMWSLLPEGIEYLKSVSGLALRTEEEPEQYGIDIAIVCALEYPEFSSVVQAFGGDSAWRAVGTARFPHVYRSTTVITKAGRSLSVIGTTSTSMGLTAASIVTTQLVMQFRPRIVAMIGIAAGTREGNKQYGDVLVADPSVDYNSGKVVFAEGVRGFLPDPYPIGLNPRLRSILLRYRGEHPIFQTIRSGWSGHLPASANRLHVGPLGAADQVIDDAARVLEIQRNWRKLIGVEMETYGVYRACHESPEPKPRFVSFKSVCDFAAEKSDSWQEYAAYVAAQFALRFLKAEWENLWHKL